MKNKLNPDIDSFSKSKDNIIMSAIDCDLIKISNK